MFLSTSMTCTGKLGNFVFCAREHVISSSNDKRWIKIFVFYVFTKRSTPKYRAKFQQCCVTNTIARFYKKFRHFERPNAEITIGHNKRPITKTPKVQDVWRSLNILDNEGVPH